MSNPINYKTGSDRIATPMVLAGATVVIFLFALLFLKTGSNFIITLCLLPFIIVYVNLVFRFPKYGLYGVIVLAFIANGLSKYISGIPFGLSIDVMLVLTYIAIFFKHFFQKFDWSPAANSLTLVVLIWFGFSLLQLVNPEAQSRTAWFYAVRGVSMYLLLIVPLGLTLFGNNKQLDTFLKIWGVFAILASLKGAMQLYLGVDPWEQRWLDAGNASTHVLWGKLRVFSFYSDAGQFGAAQAHAGTLATILFFNTKKRSDRIFWGGVAIMGFWGLFISGTRGAISIPFAAFFVYFILTRNLKIITLGIIMGIAVFIFFKYTSIGSGNYSIQRMRTAFNPEDPSLQVRLENQRKLRQYLASRPIGGGIGSAGYWGLRYSPHTFLANTPTDSWYVAIWAEQGIVGLTAHLIMLFFILGRGSYISIFRVRDPVLQSKLFAMASGIFGIMVASYANSVLGQMPTGILLYISMTFLFNGERLQKELEFKQIQNKQLNQNVENR